MKELNFILELIGLHTELVGAFGEVKFPGICHQIKCRQRVQVYNV